MSNFSENLYIHGFNLLPQFGPKRLLKLFNYFENFKTAFHSNVSELVAAGIEPELAEKFAVFRTACDLEKEAEQLATEHIQLLGFTDTNYPNLLKEIPACPPLLYYKGTMNNPDELALAVVGTRKISAYGRTVLPYLIEPLIDAGITIVSGLAYGVDSAAHKLCVEKGMRTIALLGCGVDSKTLYPKDHAFLADEIVNTGGAIVSEYPPGTPALKQHFVARNRIISGYCLGTLLIECNLKSGTLITAQHALDQNRTVYAVPGQIYTETSRGPNNLIKMGAKLVTEAADILSDLNIASTAVIVKTVTPDTKEEQILLDLLVGDPIHADELIKSSGLDTGQVTTTLTFLEMKGKVRNVGGNQYIRIR